MRSVSLSMLFVLVKSLDKIPKSPKKIIGEIIGNHRKSQEIIGNLDSAVVIPYHCARWRVRGTSRFRRVRFFQLRTVRAVRPVVVVVVVVVVVSMDSH